MPLDTFTLPKPDVRLVMLEDTVYKVKLNLRKVHQSSSNEKENQEGEELLCSNKENQEDIEKTLLAVLGLGILQPIQTTNLIIYPYRKKWETAEKLEFHQNSKLLKACPYVHLFYIEKKQVVALGHEMTESSEQQAAGVDSSVSPTRQQESNTRINSSKNNDRDASTASTDASQTLNSPVAERNLRAKTLAKRKRKYPALDCEPGDCSKTSKEDNELNESSSVQESDTDPEDGSNSSVFEAATSFFVTPIKRLLGGLSR